MNSLIGQLDQSVLLCEQDAQIHRELQRNAELQHGIEKRDTKINERDIQINERDIQINELDLQILNSVSQLEQLHLHSKQQAQHLSDLERGLNTIYDSASWKLMGPIRRVGRILGAGKNSKSGDSDSDK